MMRRLPWIRRTTGPATSAALLLMIMAGCSSPRQVADSSFDTTVARPAYVDEHPGMLFDEAHRNIHTSGGLYKPFVRLATNDGYRVTANKEPFSRATLEGHRVLVIANALGSSDANDGPAFTEPESQAVQGWVQAGGALLLITDHAPTGAAAETLARRFGVEMSKGMTEDPTHHDVPSGDSSQLLFTRENRLLRDHPVTRGRDAGERVNRVMTFTGQSLKAGDGQGGLLELSESAVNRPASVRVEKSGGDTRVLITYGEPEPARGFAQAVALEHGKGRVVVLGEAAMLTAQLDGKTKKPFGMNVPGVDNRQFALNILHWLSRSL